MLLFCLSLTFLLLLLLLLLLSVSLKKSLSLWPEPCVPRALVSRSVLLSTRRPGVTATPPAPPPASPPAATLSL